MQGLYKIQNSITGKFYVGSSKNIVKRLRDHKWMLKNGKHYNKHLQGSWNIHGEDNFIFSVIKEVVGSSSFLLEEEEQFIKSVDKEILYNKLYNITNMVTPPASKSKWDSMTLEQRSIESKKLADWWKKQSKECRSNKSIAAGHAAWKDTTSEERKKQMATVRANRKNFKSPFKGRTGARKGMKAHD